MRFLQAFSSAVLLLAAGTAQAASSWSFDDATLQLAGKKGAAPLKYRFTPKTALGRPVPLSNLDTLKVILTTTDNGKAKRPHQAFVVLKEQETGLEAPFPLTVKETGRAVAQISQKDLPVQFLLSTQPLKASIVVGSFGSSQGLDVHVFEVRVVADPAVAAPTYEAPLRYGKKEEIHHIFRADPQSPPKAISLVFVLAVLATVPALFLGWIALGANANHLSKALSAAPLSHGSFFGSIVAMELVFYKYYTSWNLFQTLPVIGIVGVVTILSGRKALGEVQSRRLAGER